MITNIWYLWSNDFIFFKHLSTTHHMTNKLKLILNLTRFHKRWRLQDFMESKCSKKAKTQTQEDIEGNDKVNEHQAIEIKKSFLYHVLGWASVKPYVKFILVWSLWLNNLGPVWPHDFKRETRDFSWNRINLFVWLRGVYKIAF